MTEKSYKREAGAGVLVVTLAITIKFWFFLDAPEMVTAYTGAWNIGAIGLAAVGLAPFGLHAVLGNKK